MCGLIRAGHEESVSLVGRPILPQIKKIYSMTISTIEERLKESLDNWSYIQGTQSTFVEAVFARGTQKNATQSMRYTRSMCPQKLP